MNNNETIALTRDLILALRTPRGGWNYDLLRRLGVKIPLTHGWVTRLVGTTIRRAEYDALVAFGSAKVYNDKRDSETMLIELVA